jgi:hypothetical protein
MSSLSNSLAKTYKHSHEVTSSSTSGIHSNFSRSLSDTIKKQQQQLKVLLKKVNRIEAEIFKIDMFRIPGDRPALLNEKLRVERKIKELSKKLGINVSSLKNSYLKRSSPTTSRLLTKKRRLFLAAEHRLALATKWTAQKKKSVSDILAYAPIARRLGSLFLSRSDADINKAANRLADEIKKYSNSSKGPKISMANKIKKYNSLIAFIRRRSNRHANAAERHLTKKLQIGPITRSGMTLIRSLHSVPVLRRIVAGL